jgi:general secretion pathway protein G
MKTLHQSVRASRRGFSLAEMMVVIVIIGLLATLVVPNVVARLFTGQVGKAKSDIMTIVNALEEYCVLNNGTYPDSLEALVTPDANTGQTILRQERVPLDPWKNEYGYEPPGAGRVKPRVFTYGADGAPGGEGKDRDFDNIDIQNGDV